ncbi:MBOAT family O-acyltransferase [Domibacillus mangrovi]|uniref:Membrane-bound O-acyltransferase family protein n=1 Tax=Domibacillus mangrovi TaxID=1714354 RepID=A0A1Q5P2A6_9BACI|nr:MBOAT family protein [Domibacillus mangrovi]OKL36377.1 membrane-bound O-acyltransferase family protein [Domibacillus mangrovi]
MIFNSFEFIFLFLPIVLIVYFLLNKWNFTIAKSWLLVSSFFFYGYWSPAYLPLIFLSLAVNFLTGHYLSKNHPDSRRKTMLTLGILFNAVLLGYFKYYDFFAENVNVLFDANIELKNALLPLAISFYTFQQIAYLVDSYRKETSEYNFLNYSLFVTFFPQLIAGPIVHHSQVMDQFQSPDNQRFQSKNVALGLFVFSIGLFKKVVIADTFAVWANKGYSMSESLTFVDSWLTTLAYTFQLYFDFSGYSDMAIGLGLLFNIHLPRNFFSPYKATSIQDFWRRWHITLSNFLTTYIYIPLGGNRKGRTRTYLNIFIVFLVSGFWHGAGWTFIIWGVMHGMASMVNRAWASSGRALSKPIAWLLTFLFVHLSWVFFRSPDLLTAVSVLRSMAGFNGVLLPKEFIQFLDLPIGSVLLFRFELGAPFIEIAIWTIIALVLVLFTKNSIQLRDDFTPKPWIAVTTACLFIYSATRLQQVSEFLYFNF